MKQIRKKRSPKGISSCIYTCIGIDLDLYDWYCEQPNRTRLINDLLRQRKLTENSIQLRLDFEKEWCDVMNCPKNECVKYQILKNCDQCKL